MVLFWSTFFLIFCTEIVDKSRLAGFLLSTTYQAPVSVFFGMTLGYIVIDALAVMVGHSIPSVSYTHLTLPTIYSV